MITEPSRLTNASIREYAERIGEHYGIYNRAGTCDVQEFVLRLGGRISYGDSPESLHVNAPGDFTIFLPKLTSSRRDRFTIAHELGHYFLHFVHPRREPPASFGRGERNTAETQANVFASSLLMPAASFETAWTRSGGDVYRLASQFEVSPAAVEVRAQVLGLA